MNAGGLAVFEGYESGTVGVEDARGNLLAELSPDDARALAVALNRVASYVERSSS